VKLEIGSVVRANAGRDCGGFFAVTQISGGCCFIADGKSRKLSSPKRKNLKHISPTDSIIENINDITDKKLRTLLREFSAKE